MQQKPKHWKICVNCHGRGKIKPHSKTKRQEQDTTKTCQGHNPNNSSDDPLKFNLYTNMCIPCHGSGLMESKTQTEINEQIYPHIAIVGAGIGGTALALACKHRGIPYSLFERDLNANIRSQGYGLTLQQASNATKALGLGELPDHVISNRHLVHKINGEVIAEWGMRRWLGENVPPNNKRKNIHIPRRSLRQHVLDQINYQDSIFWAHTLRSFNQGANNNLELTFETPTGVLTYNTDLLVAADGIHSTVRGVIFPNDTRPLQYVGCLVILGICPLEQLEQHDLLDKKTVFQTVNGHDRIYVMPYDGNHIMWQLSIPMQEQSARSYYSQGVKSLQTLSRNTVKNWHAPITEIIEKTQESLITGYPVYDREPLDADLLSQAGPVTLIGDAAHPMSPFKGQGANQAILDALSLAREISVRCTHNSQWKSIGIRKTVLNHYEQEMIHRTKPKVEGSAQAAQLLHSPAVLRVNNDVQMRTIKKTP